MAEKTLTGRIAAERIRMQSTPKPPAGAVERFLALGECTSLISDVMDDLGVPEGVIGATALKPTLPGQLIVGPALTVRNIRQRSDPLKSDMHANRMAEFEAHNLAEDGDVLVISGVSGMSNMGGISAMTGKRQGERGAIVMGGVRDVRHSRSIGYPVWASEITPVTGKWRLETVEINGEIDICGVRVNPGRSRGRRRHRRLLHPARGDHAGTGNLREEKASRGHAHGRHYARCRGADLLRQRLGSRAASRYCPAI
jgi:4-hydroxy-4-methyl-2-oxoglutarate aldolase